MKKIELNATDSAPICVFKDGVQLKGTHHTTREACEHAINALRQFPESEIEYQVNAVVRAEWSGELSEEPAPPDEEPPVEPPNDGGANDHQPPTEPPVYGAITKDSLKYLGAFLSPDVPFSWDHPHKMFGYGSRGVAFNPKNNSLFLSSHTYAQLTAEVTIEEPTLDMSALKSGTILQGFAEVTDGRREDVSPKNTSGKPIGGYLTDGERLITSVLCYYDARVTQVSSHFAGSTDLAKTGEAVGPVKVGDQYPGFVSGYMCWIPEEHREAFGGPALTGNACLAIISHQSLGPAASVFDPADIKPGVTQIPAVPVVGYPYGHALGGGGWASNNPLYGGATQIHGMEFVGDSLLFFGRNGIGPFCYGIGQDDPDKWDGHGHGDAPHYCYDPVKSAKGVHGYPYQVQVWAYSVEDLLKVRRGEKQQWEIEPYAVWHYDWDGDGHAYELNGTGYDPVTQRLYVVQRRGNKQPKIHVYEVR